MKISKEESLKVISAEYANLKEHYQDISLLMKELETATTRDACCILIDQARRGLIDIDKYEKSLQKIFFALQKRVTARTYEPFSYSKNNK